jgi:hypothetical protein
MLIGGVVWRAHSHQPQNRPRIEISRQTHSQESALEWVDIPEDAAPGSSRMSTPLVLTSSQLAPMAVSVEGSQPAGFAEVSDVSALDTDISDLQARLQGQYVKQVNARIERAWLRPRTAIGDAQFLCQVRIEQDAGGNVREIALESCNGSPRWQLSLVHAIQSASPLPAPSDAAVSAAVLHMKFEAVAVESAQSVEQYEPSSSSSGTAGDQSSSLNTVLRQFPVTSAGAEPQGAVNGLRLEPPECQETHIELERAVICGGARNKLKETTRSATFKNGHSS